MSLRVRLLLAVGAVAVVALAVADVATYSSLRSFLYQRVDQSLDATRIDRGHLDGPSRAYFALRDADGTLHEPPNPFRQFGGEEVSPRLPTQFHGAPNNLGEYHLTVHAVQNGGPLFRVRGAVLDDGTQVYIALPLDDVKGTLRRLLGVEIFVTFGALGAAAALGWWLVRLGLRPLAEIEETADAIAEGDMDRRVPGEDESTEVGRLARALNVMLGRIQDAFGERDATEARLRRFVADASHELRTPVAAVAAYAELFGRGANTRPEDLERVMRGISTETTRMGELVQDLLLLARLDEGRPLDDRPVELVGLAAQAVDAGMAVGPAWPVRLDASEPVEIAGDRTRLRQVLDNLLANVRAHTPPGTAATVTIARQGGEATIVVKDDGPGLSEEQRERVFERFYRADPSRSRQLGGTGLGLAIVAAIVDAHGGRVSVLAPPTGASFEVRLPLAQAAPSDEGDDGESGDGTDAPKSDAIRK